MRASLGQPIIIENVSGAARSIGAGRVARAAPDGYTLVLGYWGTHVVNGTIYALQYHVLDDFEPIEANLQHAARKRLFTGTRMFRALTRLVLANLLGALAPRLVGNPMARKQGEGEKGLLSYKITEETPMTTLNAMKLTNFVPGDDRRTAWTVIVTVESGEQVLLSLSLEVATQMFGQLHAALLQASRQG